MKISFLRLSPSSPHSKIEPILFEWFTLIGMFLFAVHQDKGRARNRPCLRPRLVEQQDVIARRPAPWRGAARAAGT